MSQGTVVFNNDSDHVVIIDGDSDDPVENTTPDDSCQLDIQDVRADDGRVTWLEEINMVIPDPIPIRIDGRSGKSFRYKGTVWSTLVVLFVEENKFGVFLGIDSPESMPAHMTYKFNFKYDLLDSEGTLISTGITIDNTFQRRTLTNLKERTDCGNWYTFTEKFSLRYFIDRYAIRQDGAALLPFQLRMHLEDHFVPASAPAQYNSKAATGMVGLENLGATCYLNSLLQMLYHVNAFRKLVYNIPIGDSDVQNSTTLALQSVFKNLQYSDREVTTKDLTAAFGWTSAEAFMQQDIQEMLRILLDKLEEKMKGTPLDGRVQQLFAGKVRSYIQCVHVDFASNREEDFYDIQLDVKGCRTVYDSLKKYVEIEMLDGENQYDADRYGKQDARKGVIFTRFPPVLTMHLKRFDFDFATMGFKKIHDYYEFPTLLDIDPYLAEDSPPESRAVANHYILHSVLVHAGDVGGGHYYAYIRPSTTENYQTVYTVKDIQQSLATASQATASANAAVPSSTMNRGDWFKFNDETVLSVDNREAVQHCYGRRFENLLSNNNMNINEPNRGYVHSNTTMSSAYMLVYIRADDAASIMAPITEVDIPRSLISRLDREKKRKIALERQIVRSKMLTTIRYATEDHLRAFHNYHRFADLIEEHTLPSTSIFSDCTFLGLHLHLSKLLRVSPRLIRLWRMMPVNHLPTQKGAFVRIKSCIGFDEYSKRFHMDIVYFVEVFNPEEEATLHRRTNDESSLDDPAVEEAEFQELWSELLARFQHVHESAMAETQKYPELLFLPDDESDSEDDTQNTHISSNSSSDSETEHATMKEDAAIAEKQAQQKKLRQKEQRQSWLSLWEKCIIGGGNKIMFEFREFDYQQNQVTHLRQLEKEINKDAVNLLFEFAALNTILINDPEKEEYPIILKVFDPQLRLGPYSLEIKPTSAYAKLFPGSVRSKASSNNHNDKINPLTNDIPHRLSVSSVFPSLTSVSSATATAAATAATADNALPPSSLAEEATSLLLPDYTVNQWFCSDDNSCTLNHDSGNRNNQNLEGAEEGGDHFIIDPLRTKHVMKTIAFYRAILSYPVSLLRRVFHFFITHRYRNYKYISNHKGEKEKDEDEEETPVLTFDEVKQADLFLLHAPGGCEKIPLRHPEKQKAMQFQDLLTPDTEGNIIIVLSLADTSSSTAAALTSGVNNNTNNNNNNNNNTDSSKDSNKDSIAHTAMEVVDSLLPVLRPPSPPPPPAATATATAAADPNAAHVNSGGGDDLAPAPVLQAPSSSSSSSSSSSLVATPQAGPVVFSTASERPSLDPRIEREPGFWLFYQIQKRLVTVAPFSKRDMLLLYHLHHHHHQQQHHRSHNNVVANTEEEELLLSSSSSSSSSTRKRKRSSSGGAATNVHGAQRHREITIGFDAEVPLYATLYDVFQLIYHGLKGLVPLGRLCLGITTYYDVVPPPSEAVQHYSFATIHHANLIMTTTNNNNNNNNNNTSNTHSNGFTSNLMTLSDFIQQERGYDKKYFNRQKQWIIFYRILPFSLTRPRCAPLAPTLTQILDNNNNNNNNNNNHEEKSTSASSAAAAAVHSHNTSSRNNSVGDDNTTEDVRRSHRLLNVLCTDTRVRFWRSLYGLFLTAMSTKNSHTAHHGNCSSSGSEKEDEENAEQARKLRKLSTDTTHHRTSDSNLTTKNNSEKGAATRHFLQLLQGYREYLLRSIVHDDTTAGAASAAAAVAAAAHTNTKDSDQNTNAMDCDDTDDNNCAAPTLLNSSTTTTTTTTTTAVPTTNNHAMMLEDSLRTDTAATTSSSSSSVGYSHSLIQQEFILIVEQLSTLLLQSSRSSSSSSSSSSSASSSEDYDDAFLVSLWPDSTYANYGSNKNSSEEDDSMYSVFDPREVCLSLPVTATTTPYALTNALRQTLGMSTTLARQLPYFQQHLRLEQQHHPTTTTTTNTNTNTNTHHNISKSEEDHNDNKSGDQEGHAQQWSSSSEEEYVHHQLPASLWLHNISENSSRKSNVLSEDWLPIKVNHNSSKSSSDNDDNGDIATTSSANNNSSSGSYLLLGPLLPLLVCVVRNHLIDYIVHPLLPSANHLIRCWPEVTSPFATLSRFTVQCPSTLDWLFYHNRHPHIRSMLVSVCHYTLQGPQRIALVDASSYSGPFLTYVREDDDYQSFTQRLASVSGDVTLFSSSSSSSSNSNISGSISGVGGGSGPSALKLRLAVIHPQTFVPEIIPKPSATSLHAMNSTTTNSTTTTNSNNNGTKSIYMRFAELYPDYAQASFEVAYAAMLQHAYLASHHNNNNNNNNGSNMVRRNNSNNHSNGQQQQQQQQLPYRSVLPLLGVQRSVNDVQQYAQQHLANPLFAQRQERQGQSLQATGIKIV